MKLDIDPVDLISKENKAKLAKLINDEVVLTLKSKAFKKEMQAAIGDYFNENMWDFFDEGKADTVVKDFIVKTLKAKLK